MPVIVLGTKNASDNEIEKSVFYLLLTEKEKIDSNSNKISIINTNMAEERIYLSPQSVSCLFTTGSEKLRGSYLLRDHVLKYI